MCLTCEVLFNCGFTFELTFGPQHSLYVCVCSLNKGTCTVRQVELVMRSMETTQHIHTKVRGTRQLDRRVRWEGFALYIDRIITGERGKERERERQKKRGRKKETENMSCTFEGV